MSRADADAAFESAHPRAATALVGHAEAEQALLDGYRSGRVSHAWLLGGPIGIGKATLAYRMARFVLANPDPTSPAVAKATSLAIPADHPVVRQVAGQGHPDLLVLERTVDDKGKLRSVITVDEVRKTIGFFGSTAGEGGWRICIVDTADELQYPQGSNALLKVLEEPPTRSLFLVVSHSPGRLLPTIRSRCRQMRLRPLETGDVAAAAAAAAGADPGQFAEAAAVSEGGVSRALALAVGPLAAVRGEVAAQFDRLPATDARQLHGLADSLDKAGDDIFDMFIETARGWLSARLDHEREPERLAKIADAWDRLGVMARDVDTYNLERKPLVFAIFALLADTARR